MKARFAALLAAMAGFAGHVLAGPAATRQQMAPRPIRPAQASRTGNRTGKTYPMNGAREVARRKRQIDAGILKLN